ncbi:MAG: hypothetical protein V3S68_05230 [Dehalococcoidia bacterium]
MDEGGLTFGGIDTGVDVTAGGTPTGPGPGGTPALGGSADIVAGLESGLAPGNFGLGEEDDFFARGGVMDDGTAIVGEDGPELLLAPDGARVVPISKADEKKLKKRGTKSLQEGGLVFGTGVQSPDLPIDVRSTLAGRSLAPSRGQLTRAAGIGLPSAQALRNFSPEDREVFFSLGELAGIPRGSFEQELAIGMPGGGLHRPGQAAVRARTFRL